MLQARSGRLGASSRRRFEHNASLVAAATVALVSLSMAAQPLVDDAPPAGAPKAGDVTGVVAPGENIANISAVSRQTGKVYASAKSFDRKTGAFVFADLPGDSAYDVCIELADGRRFEGIDLDFADARMLRLAELRRKELKLPPERAQEFAAADLAELLAYVRDMKDFMEIRRVLYVRGQGRRATMLVELMRVRDFYASKGQVIWRVELWYFENRFGGWEKLANQENVLRRERISPQAWSKIDVTYWPELSVYVSPEGKSSPIAFTPPDKADPSRGRPAGTEPELKSAPHVIGLGDSDSAATQPATQPTPQPGA